MELRDYGLKLFYKYAAIGRLKRIGVFYAAFLRHYQTVDTVKYKNFGHFHFGNCFLP